MSPLTLRAVNKGDSHLLWKWANDTEARKWAFSSDFIPWKTHISWLDRKLNDQGCYHFIAMDTTGTPVGQIRFDIEDNEAVASVTIDKLQRGLGYGTGIIKLGAFKLAQLTSVKVIHAFVKVDNRASIRAFEKANFDNQGTKQVKGFLCTHLVWEPGITMNNFVFVTGMFRSGTTLIARMLNAHPKIAFASDPYARLFRAFRNHVAAQTFGPDNIDNQAPLDDYYFYTNKQELMHAIQQTDLDSNTNDLNLAELRADIAQASRPYSPKIEPLLDNLTGNTFAELFQSGLRLIHQAYGDSDTTFLGFKEVWTTEFASHILRCFPQAKVVHIVRDPRAVCASKNVTKAKYPWLFLVRQWRKLVSLAWLNDHDPAFASRTLLIRFEDFLAQPTDHIHQLCDFLEIDFHENLVTPASFVDGAGQPWRQNSSHFNGRQQFNQRSVDKWREVLLPEYVEFIEALCWAEMHLLGYQPSQFDNTRLPLSLIFAPPHLPLTELANWIRPYSPPNQKALVQEMGLEQLRRQALWDTSNLSQADKARLYLDPKFFDKVYQWSQTYE